MKRICLFVLILAGLHTQAQHLLTFKNEKALCEYLQYSPKRTPLISAHRGGPQKGYPENALETFQHSILTEPLIIECDIALSKDSVMVLMHDDKLDRTSTGTGAIGNYTYAELQHFFLKDNNGDTTTFHIPTLDEVLLWGKGKVIFTLDIKRGVPYAKVIDAVHRCKAGASCVIITYNTAQATEAHKLAPELMISASVQNAEDLQRLHDAGVPDDRIIAFIGVHEADTSLYTLLHEHHIECILGTMGNLDRQAVARGDQSYEDYINHGADILSTDRPVEAGAVVQQYIKAHH
jgi:glycerophosphoryl diester phosphodiesterase